MTDLLEEYERDIRIRGMADGSILRYIYTVNAFKQFIGKRRLEKVTKNDIREYAESLRQRGLVTKTISFHMAALSSFYEYLVYDDVVETNPVTPVRKRYISHYKTDGEEHTHKLITVEEARRLVNSLVDIRDKSILLLLLKTGIRISELISLDVDDIHWSDQSILLKPTKKRTNRLVFFDDEMACYLRRWLTVRAERHCEEKCKALFISNWGRRLQKDRIGDIFREAAIRVGIHDVGSDRMEDHFSAHCGRHFFTTCLSDAGMKREYIQWLRGDAIRDAIDIYYHIKPSNVRESYLAHIPQLGI